MIAMPEPQIARRVAEVAEVLRIPHKLDNKATALSGGEMQRVAVARALVSEPEAILCDEPTGNLDSANSTEILKLLRSLPESGKRSVVMVTHDRAAAAYGDRLVTIRDGLLIGLAQCIALVPASPARGPPSRPASCSDWTA